MYSKVGGEAARVAYRALGPAFNAARCDLRQVSEAWHRQRRSRYQLLALSALI